MLHEVGQILVDRVMEERYSDGKYFVNLWTVRKWTRVAYADGLLNLGFHSTEFGSSGNILGYW